jgi:hypothetical protein
MFSSREEIRGIGSGWRPDLPTCRLNFGRGRDDCWWAMEEEYRDKLYIYSKVFFSFGGKIPAGSDISGF